MLVKLLPLPRSTFKSQQSMIREPFCKQMSSTWRKHSEDRKVHTLLSRTCLKARARNEWLESDLRPPRRLMPPNVSYGPEAVVEPQFRQRPLPITEGPQGRPAF